MSDTTADCWKHKGVQGDRSCEQLRAHTHCRNCDVYSEAAARIMQRPLPAGYRREWADYFAAEEQDHRETGQAAVIFRIGREWLALPASVAVTVAEQRRAHTLPHRSGAVLRGIVNIRGSLYPCMSLAGLLDIDDAQPAPVDGTRVYPRLLAVQLQQQIFVLPVDALYGIHRHSQADLQQAPAANQSLYRYITGVLHVEKMIVGCLDAELLGHKLMSTLK